jgi:hypothetical protein
VGEVPPLTKLYEKYQSKGFEFFIVYAREAHPGEGFPHHISFDQKLNHAKKLRELEGVRIPILVDRSRGFCASGLWHAPEHDLLDRPGGNGRVQIRLDGLL